MTDSFFGLYTQRQWLQISMVPPYRFFIRVTARIDPTEAAMPSIANIDVTFLSRILIDRIA
jgi:hypothetical protein